MELQIENLKAKMRGVPLTPYQKGLALDEYYKLIDYTEKLKDKTERLGYYAKEKDTGNFYEFSWSADDKLLLRVGKDYYEEVDNKNDYEIVQLGYFKS